MKNEFDNIGGLFKQKFDGFESNIDPSVWSNIEQAISSGPGVNSVPQTDPSIVSGIAGKSLMTKFFVGLAFLGVVSTGVYFVSNFFSEDKAAVAESLVVEDVSEVVVEEVIQQKEPLIVAEEEERHSFKVKRNDPVEVLIETENVEKIAEVENLARKTEVEEPLSSKGENNLVSEQVNSTSAVEAENSAKTEIVKEEESSQNTTQEPDIKAEQPKTKVQSARANMLPKKVKRVEAVIDPVINVFSPDGDGFNDKWFVKGENLERVELVFLNNAKNIVFKIETVDGEWDGRDFSGSNLDAGTYYVAGEVIDSSGNRKSIRSAITLIR